MKMGLLNLAFAGLNALYFTIPLNAFICGGCLVTGLCCLFRAEFA